MKPPLIMAAAWLVYVPLAPCPPASAQTAPGSFAYVVGVDRTIDLAGGGKSIAGDGLPDIGIAFVHRNLAAGLRRGDGYYVKSMKLCQPKLPGYCWDTVPGSANPVLVVTRDQGGEVLNHRDGSIDGLNLARDGRLDLFVSDPSFRMAGGLAGLVLEVTTTDGAIRIPVAPSSFYEHRY